MTNKQVLEKVLENINLPGLSQILGRNTWIKLEDSCDTLADR